MKILSSLLLFTSLAASAKTFQNSYVAFEVPDDWTCVQEGVAWTCNPRGPVQSREAVIVLAAKVAGPEDNMGNFNTFLRQPKKIMTKVGVPMASQVMYARQIQLGGQNWVEAQHLGSEIQDYYTLYLATVKDRLAILISFSAEKSHYQTYNPIFDHAVKTVRITANQKLLFAKPKIGDTPAEMVGIQVPSGEGANQPVENLAMPKRGPNRARLLVFVLIGLALASGAALYISKTRRKKISHGKNRRSRTK